MSAEEVFAEMRKNYENESVYRYGIKHSMSRPYKAVDNAEIKTFWQTLKTEIGKVGHLSEE